MRALILSYPSDFHAALAHWVLQETFRVEVQTLYTPEFSDNQPLSIAFGDDDAPPRPSAHGINLPADVVWRRRIAPPKRGTSVHPDDVEFVERENRRFLDAYWPLMAPDALWVNDHANGQRANSKPFQLAVAREIGWKIPTTLFSNDPDEIRSFVSKQQDTIYKAFLPAVWKTSRGSTHTSMTSRVDDASLGSDAQLRACAGIFQKRIEKAYELRITIFGGTCIAIKLHSQDAAATELDWRVGFYSPLRAEQVSLPSVVKSACFDVLKRLGLVYGAIDVAVTPNGDYIFFEVNEMGQFLWIEEMCPDAPVLGAFCEFLASADPTFQYKTKTPVCSLAALQENEKFQLFLQARQNGHSQYLPGFFLREESITV